MYNNLWHNLMFQIYCVKIEASNATKSRQTICVQSNQQTILRMKFF